MSSEIGAKSKGNSFYRAIRYPRWSVCNRQAGLHFFLFVCFVKIIVFFVVSTGFGF